MMVISDEIFAGLWRLGSASAWERLHIVPDIACYAKLLTGKSGSQHDHIMRRHALTVRLLASFSVLCV